MAKIAIGRLQHETNPFGLSGIRAAGQFAALYLGWHGAMVTKHLAPGSPSGPPSVKPA